MDGTFEELASDAYGRFAELAARYYYTFRRPTVTRQGVAAMLFLGNHSAGKSSLVNWVLGGEAIQETGLAPTDDGFTVLVFGESEEDVCGPAALARLPAEFAVLSGFGASFLQHLKVKVRNRPLLKTAMLVDSPGMIDSAESSRRRSYDFEGVVRALAQLCDAVFVLFDPEKPGTTGETVSVFAKCLSGIEFKLHVLLNKCDAFRDMSDFARTYGTICWNLARILRTKDLPQIWTVYSGAEKTASSPTFDLADINRQRAEVLNILHNAESCRLDNVYAQVQSDLTGLSVRMRVVNHVWRRRFAFGCQAALLTVLFAGSSAFAAWYAMGRTTAGAWLVTSAIVLAGTLAAAAGGAVAWLFGRLYRVQLAARADRIFAREYRRELAAGTNDSLRQVWTLTRDETVEIIRQAPLRLPLFGEFCRRRVDRARAAILSAFGKK